MSNKQIMIRHCRKENDYRRQVYPGKINRALFYRNMKGSMIMSGTDACRPDRLVDLVAECIERKDMPTLFLSGREEMAQALTAVKEQGILRGVRVSCGSDRNYQPMYGFDRQQVCKLVQMTAQEMGCTGLADRMLLYAASILDIILQHDLLSLPAMSQLLKYDDDTVAQIALDSGLSNIIADNILGNIQAGTVLRRVVERLESVFMEISEPGAKTKYNIWSGVEGGIPVMALYTASREQKLMNLYLKEEVFLALKRVPRIRIIVDEMIFDSKEDELLKYLMDLKRTGRIDLIICSENAKEMLQCERLDFPNACLFPHATKTGFDNMSEALFGTYTYSYPVLSAGSPPTLLYSFRRDEHWHVSTEERLKVRAEDLYVREFWGNGAHEQAVIKLNNSIRLYMTPVKNM